MKPTGLSKQIPIVVPPTAMIISIINGGRYGVEWGALRAAKKFGIKTRGYAPFNAKGVTYRRPNESVLKEYRIGEHSAASFEPAMLENVRLADAVFIVNSESDRQWSNSVSDAALRLNRIVWRIDDLDDQHAIILAMQIRTSLPLQLSNKIGYKAYKARIAKKGGISLYVTGPRGVEGDNKVEKATQRFLTTMLQKLHDSINAKPVPLFAI